MAKALACVHIACLLIAAGVALRAATVQDRTQQPGQPTQAKVWIQNRGVTEAVPVSIQEVAREAAPLRVQVIGTPTVAIAAASAQTRAARQQWEYRDVTIPSGQDPAAALNAAGADGWEATGVIPTQSGDPRPHEAAAVMSFARDFQAFADEVDMPAVRLDDL
jgi:hypothetical protein